MDLDPVLLAIGQGAYGTMEGRITWVEADLCEPGWAKALDRSGFDAVMTTTALHWLNTEQLSRLYRELAGLLRDGGVFLNGDHLHFSPNQPTFRQAVTTVKEEKRRDGAHKVEKIEPWEDWWERLGQEPEMADLMAERDRRFGERRLNKPVPCYGFHEAVLVDAGFREVGVVWQDLDNRVLMAVR